MHEFQIESLKALALRLLKGLAHGERMLEQGLKIRGELGPSRVESPSTLLVCRANGEEAWSVAEELRREAVQACTPSKEFRLRYAEAGKLLNEQVHTPAQVGRNKSNPAHGSLSKMLLYWCT